MSWVTVIWSVGAGACLTLAFLQLMVWWKDRSARANLVFSVMAVAVAALAALELALMRAETPEQFGTAARWIHVPAWVIVASLVAFVRLYLRAGRRWLAWAVVGVRTLSLILNFVFSPNHQLLADHSSSPHLVPWRIRFGSDGRSESLDADRPV